MVPYTVEITVAGVAVAAFSHGVAGRESRYKSKLAHIELENWEKDFALIDVALCTDPFVGSRAIWEVERVKHLVVTRGEPHDIGLSSIVGTLRPITVGEDVGPTSGLRGCLARAVCAPIAPGKVSEVSVAGFRELKLGEKVEVEKFIGTAAFDGEREIVIYGKAAKLWVDRGGPYIVGSRLAHRKAQEKGFSNRNAQVSAPWPVHDAWRNTLRRGFKLIACLYHGLDPTTWLLLRGGRALHRLCLPRSCR